MQVPNVGQDISESESPPTQGGTTTVVLLQESDRQQLFSPGGTLVIDRAATLSQRILHTSSGKKALL